MLSPKTQETIDQLLGRAALSVDELSIGPLDSTGLLVLRILVENSDHFASTVGEERAKSFASLVKQEAAAPSGDDSSPENLESTTETTAVTAPVRGWRLSKTTATNYRGLAPWNQTIDFEFSEETILIYGPNGSGKSSLLGAVVWTLTGQAPVDSDTQEDKFKVHRPTEETSLGPSIGEWPRHCTLPPADISSEQPTCTVTVQLSRGAEDDYLFIRRSDVDGLQVSRDGASWEITEDLTGYGITPLDLQLSLAAPSMFGRRTLDQAQDTSDVLRLLLGLDDLAALGKLAGDISGNCTRRKNKLISEANGITGDIRQAAVRLEEGMPEGSAEKGVFGQLLATEILVDDVKSCGEVLNGLLANILTEIASAVGFGAEHDEEPPTGLHQRRALGNKSSSTAVDAGKVRLLGSAVTWTTAPGESTAINHK
ncbi:MAG: AAA family ATPase [Rhodospirillales bacterium]